MDSNRLHIFFLLILCCFTAKALSRGGGLLQGRVIDAGSGDPLPYTNVFLANTTMGDAADDDGVFLIENIPAGSYQLVVSRIGYDLFVQDVTVEPSKAGKLLLRLRVKSIPGEEISVVAAQSKQRRRDLDEFSRYFLGETQNAKKCAILNPEVLSFEHASEQGGLLAFAERPLLVENKALGYRIEIILDSFRWGLSGGRYVIYPRYSPLPSASARTQNKWQKARQRAFRDSMRGFFRALSNDDYRGRYFISEIKAPDFEMPPNPNGIDSLRLVVVDSASGLRRLEFENGLSVRRKGADASYLFLNYGYVDFDANGNVYPPDAVKVYGYWVKNRVADALPFDYAP